MGLIIAFQGSQTAFGRQPCPTMSMGYGSLGPFHGGNTGSNPVGDAKSFKHLALTRSPSPTRDQATPWPSNDPSASTIAVKIFRLVPRATGSVLPANLPSNSRVTIPELVWQSSATERTRPRSIYPRQEGKRRYMRGSRGRNHKRCPIQESQHARLEPVTIA